MTKKQKRNFIIIGILVVLILIFMSSNKSLNISTTPSLSINEERFIQPRLFSTGLELCQQANDCPAETEQKCQQNENGDWFYICEPIGVGCDDPSYSLDCLNYCPDGVYAYNFDVCCPTNNPFTGDGSSCSSRPVENSDNYFLRRSTCWNVFTDNWLMQTFPSNIPQFFLNLKNSKCEGTDYLTCSEKLPFIQTYDNQGQVTGKCGIECQSDFDCPTPKQEKFCRGNLIQKTIENNCNLNKCVIEQTGEEIIETCQFGCGEVNDVFQCLELQCDDGELKCSGNDLLVCGNDEFGLVETCEFGCENEKCNSAPFPISLIVIGIIIVGGGLIFVFIKIRKKNGKI